MATRTAYDAQASTVLTATNLDKHAGGWLGYVEVTADQSSIVAVADLASLTLTVTVNTSRKVRVSGECQFYSSVANDVAGLQITNGSNTQLQERNIGALGTTYPLGCGATYVTDPGSGSNTWKLRARRVSGTGSISMGAASTYPAFILVEDLGSV